MVRYNYNKNNKRKRTGTNELIKRISRSFITIDAYLSIYFRLKPIDY